MNSKNYSNIKFQFLEAYLIVNRIRTNPDYLIALNTTLAKGGLTRYNLTRVELKTFTLSRGPKSMSIDIVVLGQMPKRLLITMIKNKDFLGSLDTNPYYFHHFDLTSRCSTTVNRSLARVCPWTWAMRNPRSWLIILCLWDRAYVTRTRGCN